MYAGVTASMPEDAAVEVGWDQVLRWRLVRQGLGRRGDAGDFLTVARTLSGVHAQLMSSAELTLWARVNGLERGAVGRAVFEDRSLVKTWAMRGTLHLFAASDYPEVLAALQTKRGYNDGFLRSVGMTAAEMETITEAIGQALDGNCLTRSELSQEVGRVTGSGRLAGLVMQSWGDLLKPAAYRGYLCAGPSRGRNVTYVRPDQWLPRWREPGLTDPVAAMLRRYLHVYGPASREDFARWWGATPPVIGELLRQMHDELRQVRVDGYRAWMLHDDVAELTALDETAAVHIVPAFDAYVVSSFLHADQLVTGGVAKTRVYRPQGWVSAVVLAGGRFAGVWKHEARRGGEVRVELFGRLGRSSLKELRGEVERVRGFLGLSGEVVIG